MNHAIAGRLLLAVLVALTACASADTGTLVPGPVHLPPHPEPTYVERVPNGAIYQAHMAPTSLFSGERRARAIGDTLKVQIAEKLSATQKLKTDTSRDNKLAVKGPGGSSKSGLINQILNADATTSGSDSFEGSGETENSSSFSGQIAATVINVLPNGHLVVAGERSVAMNGGLSTLRFSGVVDPRDIRTGNQVQSVDVANAKLELAGRGDVSDASRRSWLQRVMAQSLAIW